MTDLADFVYAAGRNEKIDCDALKDRISWLSNTFSDDPMANDIVALLSEYSQGVIRKPFAFFKTIQRGFSGSIQTLPR